MLYIVVACAVIAASTASATTGPSYHVELALDTNVTTTQTAALKTRLARDTAIGSIRYVSCREEIVSINALSPATKPLSPGYCDTASGRRIFGGGLLCLTARSGPGTRAPAWALVERYARLRLPGVRAVELAVAEGRGAEPCIAPQQVVVPFRTTS